MSKYLKFKAFFYNGFSEPKLIATSISSLNRNVKITDTYRGDCSSELRDEIDQFKNKKLTFNEFKERLWDLNILIDPTREELISMSKQWFGNSTPYHHFVNFN